LQPVESSPTFVLFVLPSGLKLGLWSRHTAEPKVLAYGGSSELAFSVPDRSVVNDLYADWAGRGLASPSADGDGLWLHLRRPRPRGHRCACWRWKCAVSVDTQKQGCYIFVKIGNVSNLTSSLRPAKLPAPGGAGFCRREGGSIG
jgi:hypothetical protein